MVKYSPSSIDAAFSALADPIRRGILERLARGEAPVGELAEPYNVSAPAISRHLRVLEHAGLLTRTKRGRVHHCRLNPHPMADAAEWIADCRRFWEGQLDSLEKFLNEPDNQKESKEKNTWPRQARVSTPLSKSNAPSKRPAKRSSKPGRTPKS